MLGETIRYIAVESVMSSCNRTRQYSAFGFILRKSVIAIEEVLAEQKWITLGGIQMKPITRAVWGSFPN
jgi:hypothetical protein